MIAVRFPTRDALRDSLVETDGEMAMLVPGDFALTAGTPVLLRISPEGLDPGMFLEGVVQLRRRRTREGSDIGLAEIEVKILPRERARFQFIQAWSAGKCEANGRRSWRFPYDSRVHLQALGIARTTSRLMHTATLDVSATGTRVLTPRPLARGESVVLLTSAAGAMRDFQGEVVWSQDARAGVRLILDSMESRTEWAILLHRAEAAIASSEVRVLRTSLPPRVPSTRP